MSEVTVDSTDKRLGYGVDQEKTDQHEVYLVLSDEEKSKGFVRPVRTRYTHNVCGGETVMALSIAETYARDPEFYGATYCFACHKHLPVSEFKWLDGSEVGS